MITHTTFTRLYILHSPCFSSFILSLSHIVTDHLEILNKASVYTSVKVFSHPHYFILCLKNGKYNCDHYILHTCS